MGDDVPLPQTVERDFDPQGRIDPGASLADPLKEIRQLKRRVQVGVYLAILGYAPLYLFVLGYQPRQVLSSWITGIIIATVAIELAFNEITKLKKRSAYPGVIVLQLGGLDTPATACRQAVEIIMRLLRLRAAFLALQSEPPGLSLAAMAGISRLQAERLLHLGMMNAGQALQSAMPVPFRPPQPLLADVSLDPRERLIFVPLVALEKPIGVLAVIGTGGNRDLKDSPLLGAMGTALGLSLENLRQKEELREIAAVDELTGVYNRRHFFEQLEREVAEARRYNSRLAVLLVDLDGLKRINDDFGHRAGDEALRTVAQRLVRQCRAADMVARLGGDEFVVILPRSSQAGARELADRLSRAVAGQSIHLPNGTILPLAVSCGSAAFPDDTDDIEELLREADVSMYKAKSANRARRKVQA